MSRKYCLLLLVILLLSSCSSVAGGENSATQEARSATVVARATEMGKVAMSTEQARKEQTKATAESLVDQLTSRQDWPLQIFDPFDDNVNDWLVGESSDELAEISWEIVDSAYHWQAQANEGFIWWSRPELDDLEDVYAAVDVNIPDGPDTAHIGLVFRHATNSRYYTFMIRPNVDYPDFSLDWHSEDGWASLIDWTASDAILPGESNHLGVFLVDDQMYLLINEQWVAVYPAENDLAGSVGIVIGLSEAGEQGQFIFDNFEVRIPNDR